MILFVVKIFVYPLYDAMCSFCCGVPLSKAELMIWYKSTIFNHFEETFQEEFLKKF
jgi:hypothetical protein